MQCPNCQKLFVKEQAGKFRCEDCGWFEKVDDEWRVCEAPEHEQEPSSGELPEPEQGTSSEMLPEPEPPEPDGPQPPEPEPQPPEPDGPQPSEPVVVSEPEPGPDPKVKKILGGLITITEVDE